MKNYVKSMTAQDQYDNFCAVLERRAYNALLQLFVSGYTLTGRMLERLRVLDCGCTIRNITELAIFDYDGSAVTFLEEFLGKTKTEEILQRVASNKQQKIEETAKKVQKEKDFQTLLQQELSDKTIEFLKNNHKEFRFFAAFRERFGEQAMYDQIKSAGLLDELNYQFSFGIGLSDGRFYNLENHIRIILRSEEDLREFVEDMLTRTGGAEALFNTGHCKVSELLVKEYNRKDLFTTDIHGYHRLARLHLLTQKDWKDWYKLDADDAKDYAPFSVRVMMSFWK